MTSQLDTEPQHGLTELVSGVVDDAQEVMKQEIKLIQIEVMDKVRHYSLGAGLLVLGLGVLYVSGILFAFAGAYAMVSQWPTLPVWGAFAIVGVILVFMAVVLALIAKGQFTEFKPSNALTEGSKENTQWTTKK